MFGRPRTPVDAALKAWIDFQLAELIDQVGMETLRIHPVRLPTREDFPEVFEDPEDVEAIAARVASHLGVSPDGVAVCVVAEDPDAATDPAADPEQDGVYRAGHYLVDEAGPRIAIPEALLEDPGRVVALLAVERCRHELLERGIMDRGHEDGRLLADLYAGLHGFGVLNANAQVRETAGVRGDMQWWRASTLGGLDTAGQAYLLALLAWLRQEKKPGWLSVLRPDMAIPCRANLKYLRKTGDALLQPDGTRSDPADLSDWKLVELLQSGSDSACINALWHLATLDRDIDGLDEALLAAVDHEHRHVRSVALATVRARGLDTERTVAAVQDALADESGEVRLEAVSTLAAICSDPAVLRRELVPLLERDDAALVQRAAMTLAQVEGAAEDASPRMIRALERALRDHELPAVGVLLLALERLTGDARATLQAHGVGEDPIQASYLEEAFGLLDAAEKRAGASSEGDATEVS